MNARFLIIVLLFMGSTAIWNCHPTRSLPELKSEPIFIRSVLNTRSLNNILIAIQKDQPYDCPGKNRWVFNSDTGPGNYQKFALIKRCNSNTSALNLLQLSIVDTLIQEWKLYDCSYDKSTDARLYRPVDSSSANAASLHIFYDTNKINHVEENALSAFYNCLDTIRIFDGDKGFFFNKKNNQIYFSGIPAELFPWTFGLMAYSLDKNQKDFFDNVSTYALQNIHLVSSLGRHVIKPSTVQFNTDAQKFNKDTTVTGDISITMSTPYYFRHAYYVYFFVNIHVNWIHNYFLIKLNEKCEPVDVLKSGGVS